MQEVNEFGRPVGPKLCGKRSQEEFDALTEEQFHYRCAITQEKSSRLAKTFNQNLERRVVPTYIPRIEFLDCCLNLFETEINAQKQNICVLCEERLDKKKYKKWTNNAGGVHNVPKNSHQENASMLACIDENE
jgi:hypothetical protein